MVQKPCHNFCTKYIDMEAPYCIFINYLKFIDNCKIWFAISQYICNINAWIIDKMLSSIHGKAKYISIPIDSTIEYVIIDMAVIIVMGDKSFEF